MRVRAGEITQASWFCLESRQKLLKKCGWSNALALWMKRGRPWLPGQLFGRSGKACCRHAWFMLSRNSFGMNQRDKGVFPETR